MMSLNAEDDHLGTIELISEPARKRKKKQMQKKSTSDVARMLLSMESNNTVSKKNVSLSSDSADDLPIHEIVALNSSVASGGRGAVAPPPHLHVDQNAE